MSNISSQMRDNPLPLLLISAGVGLIISRTMRNDGYKGGFSMHRDDASGDLMRRTADPTAGFGSDSDDYSYRSSRSGVSSSVRGAVSSATNSVGSRASSLADTVSSQASSLVDTVTSKASALADSVSGQASSLADTVKDTYSDSVDRVSEMTGRAGSYTRNARSGLSTLATEQPLVLGALGLLAGAALAAMLPRTQMEAEYVGSAAQQLRDQATNMASETFERAKSAASKAVEVANQEFADVKSEATSDAKSEAKSDAKASSGGPSQSGVSSPGGTSSAGAQALGVSSGAGGARPTETIAAGSSQGQGSKTKA